MNLINSEVELLREFLFEYLDIEDETNWANLIDWLRQVEKGEREFFLDMFSRDEEMYELLVKILLEDESVMHFVSHANALIQRVSYSLISEASSRVRGRLCTEINQLISESVKHFQLLAKNDQE
ncbi:hypothetical protein HQ571_02710 [Candidatus Kuenenbacteria bacterium]|nr:hypothetical protein [Candidatus Kuenenbacteria bacterium]